MLRYRKGRIFPRQVSDMGAFIFVTVMIPSTFIYEVGVVVSHLYGHTSSFYVHLCVGMFLLLNIVGNFFRLWLVDTSTRFTVLPSTIEKRWKFCAVCESLMPPRAWHCSTCNICVLKREHHCMFVGYCVGHRNHRFFCLFLFYLWVAVGYCTYFNTLFLMQHMATVTWPQLLKFLVPMIMLVTGIDASWLQMYIFFWSVHFASFLLTSVLLIYHINLVINGTTTFERNHKIRSFDLGWQQNLLEVFGFNWKVALVWPFVESKLPHNGVNWDDQESWKLNGPKQK